MGRASTDPYSNTTYFPDINILRDFDSLVSFGDAPTEYLMTFLHEGMHHWCFDSLVGGAVQTLRMSARRKAMEPESSVDRTALYAEVAVGSALLVALGPLLEGLALTCELDAHSFDHFNYVSMVRSHAASLFGLPTQLSNPTVFSELDYKLFEERRSNRGVQRRLNVYGKALSDDDGYLIGYLAVRGMHRKLKEAIGIESLPVEVSLGYLRAYFLEDWELVDLALGLAKNCGPENLDQINTEIFSYLRDRIDRLANVTSEQAARFAKHRGILELSDSADWLGFDRIRGERGRDSLQELMHQFNHPPRGAESHLVSTTSIHEIELGLLRQRDLLDLGTAEITLEIRESDYAVHHGDRVLFTGVSRCPTHYDGPGFLEVVLATRSPTTSRMILVSCAGMVIGVVVSSAGDEDLSASVNRMFLSRERLRSETKILDQALIETLGNSLESFYANAHAGVEGLYADLLPWGPELPPDVVDRIRESGLRSILGKELSQALAILNATDPAPGDAKVAMLGKRRVRESFSSTSNDLFDELLKPRDDGMWFIKMVDNDRFVTAF